MQVEVKEETREFIKKSVINTVVSQFKIINHVCSDGKPAKVESFEKEIAENPFMDSIVDFISNIAMNMKH